MRQTKLSIHNEIIAQTVMWHLIEWQN